VCVIVSGCFLGITNTLMTQVVMESAPVARPIASSAYSFVRFCGGAVAPFVAGKLAEHVSAQAPFFLGAAMTAIGVGPEQRHGPLTAPVAAQVAERADVHVIVIHPSAGALGRPVAASHNGSSGGS
jgi:MFS family permease